MGSECSEYSLSKRCYDISMSKRTRKPVKLEDTDPKAIRVDGKDDATNPRSLKEPMKPVEEHDEQRMMTGSPQSENLSRGSSEDVSDHRSLKEPMKPIEGAHVQKMMTGSPRSENPSIGSGDDVSEHRSLKEPMKPIEGADVQKMMTGSPQSDNASGDSSEDVSDHRSLKLKELMTNVEGKQKNGNGNQGDNSLGHHFIEEEKQLQLVTKLQEDRPGGDKMRAIISRYVKVLSRLIRVKGDRRLGSGKKPVLRLTM
ncbi:hypothetical protein NE237_003972 [Protea cynaroides]|uniref:Uncharacterized protein n=1 Tax=Protea cynaroides TaxID=273540 RepID=A0A9Q0QT36_9MAGN|nr:hypothetical protein NE237_003972 [Protea cynaroides]